MDWEPEEKQVRLVGPPHEVFLLVNDGGGFDLGGSVRSKNPRAYSTEVAALTAQKRLGGRVFRYTVE